MPTAPKTEPITDSVPKVNDEIAVGADLKFQEGWWRFENGVWIFFAIVVLLDVVGAFGRGPFAKASTQTSDGAMKIEYERIERFGTPSILTIHFGPAARRDTKIELWVSDSLTKDLGNQRIVPQPHVSSLDGAGFLYTFPVTPAPNSVEFELQPAKAGLCDLTLRIPGKDEVRLKVFVVP